MDQRYHATTSLPSIDVMLNIVPDSPSHYNTNTNHGPVVNSNLLDDTTNKSKSSQPPVGHRRHVSEHITSSSSRLQVLSGIGTTLPPFQPLIPTGNLGTSTSSLTENNSNVTDDSQISRLYHSTSSSSLSPTSFQDDKNDKNIRTIQQNYREKGNIPLLRPHLPPPLQLMQPRFGLYTAAAVSNINTSFPLDMQALGVPSCNASSSISSSSRLPNRHRTHSRSLSDYSHSSSSIPRGNRWIELSEQPPFQALPPIIDTASKNDYYSNSNSNTNNHILPAAALNITNSSTTVRRPQQQHYNHHVNNKVFHSQQHFQNNRGIHRAHNNNSITISQMSTPIITACAAGNRYTCSYCKKIFSRPSSLRTHTYSHTGEKPFICNVEGCHRAFSVQSNLRRHLRIHKTTRSPDSLSIPTFTVGHGLCMSS